VKVMQTLYTIASTENAGVADSKRTAAAILNDKLERALDLFIISILYTLRTAQYAENDALYRASKYIVTDDDKNVNTKIAGNEFLWQIMENQTFAEKIKDAKIQHYIDNEQVKKIYLQLIKRAEYRTYIDTESRTPKEEKAIIKYIWDTLIRDSEQVQEYFADELQGWEDDKEMILMLMDNFFKSSSKINFLNLVSREKKDYAVDLMNTVLEKEEYITTLIQPKLINWDGDRVAVIDMILLRMGVCELLYFATIPTKVTINEYIEVAKMYSTPQSGQFVNGVLDNILKELQKENLVQKDDRGNRDH
jgi:N utilization substance protein B